MKREGDQVTKTLRIDETRCTGCNSCSLTCSFVHQQSFAPLQARIRIERNAIEAVYTPRVCIQCDLAPCIAACPVGALAREGEQGVVYVDAELCISCRKCVEACPFGGVWFDESQGVPLICDLCGGRPACVEVCALPHAIEFVDKEAE